ncbi:hypothetical protein GCM10010136_14450 [Limoniibacter endophyticus]|uniref:Uncharacterized protein n=1 Tax=Limoniibacter endophyticus TaxID=1565040 RepID=A0A8J3DI27_9HYPH|nr:hypothetical protein GCM10010136_14450 [Limoniibacter endophyticus]
MGIEADAFRIGAKMDLDGHAFVSVALARIFNAFGDRVPEIKEGGTSAAP